jgi:hypothetical protein
MTTYKIKSSFSESVPKKAINRIVILLLIIAVLIAAILWQSGNLPVRSSANNETMPITSEALVSDYGFRVRLIGVTAAGGLVDVRFKILDKDKAAVLLKDPDYFPALVAENGTIIQVPVESIQEMHLEDDGIVFMLFPNTGGVITPGSLVKIRFGNLELDPVLAQ